MDDGDGWNHQLATTLAGPMELQFSLVAGKSLVSSDMVELKPDYLSFGIASDSLNQFSGGFSYERWGKDEVLTIDSARFAFTLNMENFSLSLIPQLRTVRFYTREWFQALASRADVDGEDIGIGFSYYGLPDWLLGAEYFFYSYSRDLSPLAKNFSFLLILQPGTLELASGLNAHHTTLTASRSFANWELGCEWFRSTSAVDGSRADVGTLFITLDLTPSWVLRLRGGAQWFDGADDSSLFFGMGIDYLW